MRNFTALLLFFCLLSCRSAKSTATSEFAGDSISVSVDSSLNLYSDSSMVSHISAHRFCSDVHFLESGGSLTLSPDGALTMSGVASVNASRHDTSEALKTENVLAGQIQSSETVASTQQSSSFSQSKDPQPEAGGGLKIRTAISLFIFIIIFFIAFRIWRNLKK